MVIYFPVPKIIFDEMHMDHIVEVKLLNHLERLMEADVPEEELSEALEMFFEHMREHCADEERLMRGKGYPGYEKHKDEHIYILNELKLAIIEWHASKNTDRLRKKFFTETPERLYRHIGQMDTVAARYIATANGH